MISVVFALEFESAGFRARLQQRLCVSVWTLGVMGARSAPVLQNLLERQRPKIVVSAGFSGALREGLPVGTIVLGENFTDPRLIKNLPVPEEVRVGPVITSDQILETPIAKADLGARTGALAADLESAHLHQVCQSAGVPMVSIRCISDTVDQVITIPGDVLMDPDTGRADPRAIFRYLFRHPAKAPDFARLVRDAKTAQSSLASTLNSLLPALLRLPEAG
jgi:hypothetical protein